MKMTTLALAAGLGLAGSAASAVTVETLTIGLGNGFGQSLTFNLDAGEYTFASSVPGFSIGLFSGPGGSVGGGITSFVATVDAGDYYIFAALPGSQETALTVTISTPDTPAVPLPASAPLLALALGGAGFVARRSLKKAA